MKMREFLISLEARLMRRDLRAAFVEPAGQAAESPTEIIADWEQEAQERTRRYIEVMLERIERFSEQNRDSFEVPDRLYHASVYTGLPLLDPEIGQGLGVWFQDSLVSAAEIGVYRCLNPKTGKPYEDTNPSIYEAALNIKNFAVFPDEGSLYQMAIQNPDDDYDLRFKPQAFFDLHNIRRALVSAGYDGVYLLREETFSALDSRAITIVREHDPFHIYYGSPHNGERADPDEFSPE